MLGTFNPRNGVICAATALALHIFRHVITKARNIIQSTLAKLNVDPHTHTHSLAETSSQITLARVHICSV